MTTHQQALLFLVLVGLVWVAFVVRDWRRLLARPVLGQKSGSSGGSGGSGSGRSRTNRGS